MTIGLEFSVSNNRIMKRSAQHKIRVFSLWLLFFEGIGVRAFDAILPSPLIVWTILLFLLNFDNAVRFFRRYFKLVTTIVVFYIFFNLIKDIKPTYWILGAWASCFIVLSNYVDRPQLLLPDLFCLTKYSTYYSLVHIPIALLLKDFLIQTDIHMQPKTFMYIFYFNKYLGLWGIPRIQGFAWEPSCWSLLLNLNLILSLYYKKNWWNMLLTILAIFSCMSTTGLVVMFVAIGGYYALYITDSKLKIKLIWILLALFIMYPFVNQALKQKLDIGSGNSRYGDFAVMVAVIKESPFLGTDLTQITQNVIAMRAREEAWTVEGNADKEGYMNNAIVNGFASLFIEWGIPMALLHLYLFYKTPLIADERFKKLFILTFWGALIGAPIIHTGFFYLYPFSILIKYYKEKKWSQNLFGKNR